MPERARKATGQLVQLCQDQQRDAQAEFYRRYKQHVARTVFKVMGPDSEIEDVIQDVFIEAFRCIGKFKGKAKITTWLYRVSVNVTLQRIRKRKRLPRLARDQPREQPDHETPLRAIEREEHSRVVYEVLDTLSEKKRAVFILHEIGGLKPKEISERLGVNVLTIRTRLHYARKEFYRKMLNTDLFKGGV